VWVSGVIGATLSLGTPLVIAASGETVSQRAGVLNIGLEGTMLSAAFAAFYISYVTANPWLGVVVGGAVGLLLALLSAYFVLRLAADQVVVGTGINLLALGATGSLFAALFGRTGKLIAVETVPKFGGNLNLNLLMAFAVVTVIGSWFLLMKTRWGLAVRACGEYPPAAQAAGYSVVRLRLQAMLLAGALAGVAGAYLTLAQANSFADNMTAGRGFVVIAAVTFGRWSAWGAAGASLLIAFAYGLKYLANSLSMELPYQLMDAMPYLLALTVLAVAGRSGSGPAALGQPFKRGSSS
jgi:ABC-type uncharacterized transport system permease subunit